VEGKRRTAGGRIIDPASPPVTLPKILRDGGNDYE
jgi:hypothetical protein